MRAFRAGSILVVLVAVCAVLAGCGSGVRFGQSGPGVSGATPGSDEHPGGHAVRIATGHVPGLGTVLVDGRGRTLYSDSTDQHEEVSCDRHTPCLISWPPVTVDPGVAPRAAGGARQALIGTVPGPKPGTRVVTYHGWPLYRHTSDFFPHGSTGQSLFDNGGHWYAMSPAGRPIHRSPAKWNGGRTLGSA